MSAAEKQPRNCGGQGITCMPPMPLPVTFQFFIAMVAHAINERMTRKLKYVQEEIRVLREALRTATGESSNH